MRDRWRCLILEPGEALCLPEQRQHVEDRQ
jgi:hypothetical protein